MKLSELAAEHRLDPELLREVVADDLGIALPKGMDTALKPVEVKRILACDGLETADGKPFTPIIAKEFEEKHKKKVATKKGMETRKKKAEEEAEAARAIEAARLAEEKRKHEEALARRRAEEEAAAEAAAEAERRRAEASAQLAAQADAERVAAEQELLRREAESKRMVDAFAAMRAGGEATAAPEAAEPAATEPPAEARAVPVEEPAAPAEPPPKPLVIKPLSAPKAPVEPPPLPTPVAKVKGLGSKLASLAKETHDKADHSIKAVPKPAEAAVKADAPALSDEDRRRLIPSLVDVFTGKREPFGVNASAYRDYLHAEDVARGFVHLLFSEATGSFNIASGRPTRIADVVRQLAAQFNGDANRVLALATERPGEPDLLVGDNRRLRALGWQPCHPPLGRA